MPTHRRHEVATEGGPDRWRAHRDEAPHTHCASALLGREEIEHDRHADGIEDAGAESLSGARRDEKSEVRCERGTERRDAECRHRHEEDRLRAKAIRNPPGGRHRHRQREEVGGDNPLDVAPRVESLTDLRKRNTHDRRVETDDQRPDQNDAEGSPPLVGAPRGSSQSFNSTTIS